MVKLCVENFSMACEDSAFGHPQQGCAGLTVAEYYLVL